MEPVRFPQPPSRPDDQECCRRGCCPCIFDYYEDAMDRWRSRIEAAGGDPAAVLGAFDPDNRHGQARP